MLLDGGANHMLVSRTGGTQPNGVVFRICLVSRPTSIDKGLGETVPNILRGGAWLVAWRWLAFRLSSGLRVAKRVPKITCTLFAPKVHPGSPM
jgi:hypothetical protein